MGIKTYLVGGAVRDELLGLPIKDRDWVVAGATPKDMIKQGFRPIGQDFPVFLHPDTKEEYALARTEKKSGHGYAGFTFYTSPEISVEEDLQRRDLTINAIARDEQGNLVDPYHGQQDLNNKILRHVSSAFREDPLRILRVARFAARLAPLGFEIAPETQQLMREMVEEGEAEWLVAERVWQETSRALNENDPARYFLELSNVGALAVVMPEIAFNNDYADRDSIPLMALADAAWQSAETEIRFACAVSSNTSENFENIQNLCKRMKLPRQFKEVAELTARLQSYWQHDSLPSPEQRLNILQKADAFRRPERFSLIIKSCSYISKAAGHKSVLKKQLSTDLVRCRQVAVQDLVAKGFKGKELADAIYAERLRAISD